MEQQTNKLIIGDDPAVIAFFERMERMTEGLEHMAKEYKPALDGERYLSDREVAQRLHLSRFTLWEYRTQGKIPFYTMGRRILYKESDINKLMERNYVGTIP